MLFLRFVLINRRQGPYPGPAIVDDASGGMLLETDAAPKRRFPIGLSRRHDVYFSGKNLFPFDPFQNMLSCIFGGPKGALRKTPGHDSGVILMEPAPSSRVS